jgi:hypothetical protein
MTRFRLGIIALLFGMSSNASADLRTFNIDAPYQQEVYQALRSVLVDNPPFASQGSGRVQLLDSGQILVNASPETLDQVEGVIRAIRERPVAPAPRVLLRYWAVLGARAPANAANAVGTPPPPVLNDVLTELKRLNGDLTFRVIGTAAVASESGQVGQVEGMTLSVEQTAHAQGNTLNASIEMVLRARTPVPANVTVVGEPSDFHIGTLEVRTALQGGEFVVLGESAVQAFNLDGLVFYIVHWAHE